MSRVGLNACLSGAWHYIIGADTKQPDRVNNRLTYPFLRPVDLLLSLINDQFLSILQSLRNVLHTLEPKSVPGNVNVCQSWHMLKNVDLAVGEKAAQVANGSGSWRLERQDVDVDVNEQKCRKRGVREAIQVIFEVW